MPKTFCRQEGCPDDPESGLLFCIEHLDMKRQCKVVRDVHGKKQRCAKAARRGLEVCAKHGGSWKANRDIVARTEAVTAMRRFTKPYEGELDVVSGFEMEYRRTLGRIAWYDEQLALLPTADDLVWGRTKETEGTAPDGEGGVVDTHETTYEAREHALHELQRWERQHLLAQTKVWIGAGLGAKKLNLMRSYVEAAYSLTVKAIQALGHDPQDPEVRRIMAGVFLDQSQARPMLTATQIEED